MVRQLRRIVVAFVGGLVVAVGVAMLVLPGPAIVVIPAGLAILATEFPWARRLLHRVRAGVSRGLSLFKRDRHGPPPSHPEGPAGGVSGATTRNDTPDASRPSHLRAS